MKERPQDFLQRYGTTASNGFLPDITPLHRLPDPYYGPWELLISDLPKLMKSGQIRCRIESLSVLETTRLKSEPEWQRAYSILGFLTHAYIWGGEQPCEVCPGPGRFDPFDLTDMHDRKFPLSLPALSSKSQITLGCPQWQLMPHSTCGILRPDSLSLTCRTQTIFDHYIRSPAAKTRNGST